MLLETVGTDAEVVSKEAEEMSGKRDYTLGMHNRDRTRVSIKLKSARYKLGFRTNEAPAKNIFGRNLGI